MQIKRLFIGLFMGLSVGLNAQEHTISVEAQLKDLQRLKSDFEKYHSGLYRYTSSDSMELFFEQAKQRVKERPNVDFFAEVTWLLNKVKCGHTRGSLPQNVNNDFKESQFFLPLSVKYLGEQLYIADAYTEEGNLKKGEQILSINGKPIEEITRMIFAHHSSDGNINTSKYRKTERDFSYYYQLYIERNAQLYQLEVRGLNGILRNVSVTGEDWRSMLRMQSQSIRKPYLSLEFKTGHALMTIRTFGSGTIRSAGQDFYNFLEESFAELKKKGTKNLILDLRGNGGGDDNYGATLVAYFAKSAFRYFDRIEVTDAYSGYGNVSRAGKRNLMTSHKGLEEWQPQENRFDGNVYVLIDGWSFSTCADVATVLHHNGWATFIGEETGGGYDGNTSGNTHRLTLPNSRIRVNVPMWMYTTANIGHQYYGRGALPDFPLYQSPQDLIENKDVAMEKALGMIRK